MVTLQRYKKSSWYPISEEAIESIAQNMRENGFDSNFPILVKGDWIIDGYHRYEAATRAGVEPVVKEFEGADEDILRFVLRANGDRRHLNLGEKAAAAIIINRKLGKDMEDVAQVARAAGLKEAKVNEFISYSNDDLAGIVDGTKTQEAVKQKKAKSTQTNPTYTLTKGQAAKVASLSITMDERSKKLLARAFDLGLKALEDLGNHQAGA